MKNIKNKITIGLIISSSALYSAANDYLIVVDKTHHKYNVIENPLWVNIEPTYTPWVNTGYTKNCGQWTPMIDDQETNFNQNTSCDFEEKRTENIRQKNIIDETIKIIKQNTEHQFINKIDNRNIVVTSDPIVEERSNYDCNEWTPNINTAYLGEDIVQERTCSIDKMEKWNYSLNNSHIDNWENRYTIESSPETQNTTGSFLLGSCNQILNQGFSKGDGQYAIETSQGSLNVFCDMTTDGGGWTLLFNHDILDAGVFTTEAEAFSINKNLPSLSTSKYSILNYTDDFKQNGKFEFRLAWKGFSQKNIWKQTSNPSTSLVSGYEPINVQISDSGWGGLEKGNASYTFIDGSVNTTAWYFAIGSKNLWGGTSECMGMPASEVLAGNYCGVPNTNLWIR